MSASPENGTQRMFLRDEEFVKMLKHNWAMSVGDPAQNYLRAACRSWRDGSPPGRHFEIAGTLDRRALRVRMIEGEKYAYATMPYAPGLPILTPISEIVDKLEAGFESSDPPRSLTDAFLCVMYDGRPPVPRTLNENAEIPAPRILIADTRPDAPPPPTPESTQRTLWEGSPPPGSRPWWKLW